MTYVCIMKKKFKQWWSTSPLISTKRTITSPPQIIEHRKDNDISHYTSGPDLR